MIKILITGANSYIGTSLFNWLSQYPNKYIIETISLRDDNWKKSTFNKYDVIIHTVGIAHVDSNPDSKMEDLYYKINCDLTIETAEKAKKEGVKQFLFLSSIIVYGNSNQLDQPKIIDERTVPTPSNFYGNSKLLAEKGIQSLENSDFKIGIIRLPMVYGKGSKGNYLKLSKVAQNSPIFPNIENQRSMIHIENLCEFLRLLVDNKERGIFFPQNSEYVKTSEMVKLISLAHGKSIRLTKIFNPLIYLVARNNNVVNKVFGTVIYKKELSVYKKDYRVRNFQDSIYKTEK